MLQPEQPFSNAAWVREVGRAPSRNHSRAEQRERYPRVFPLHHRSAGGYQVHAHLTVRTDGCERTSLADIAAFDHPYLAGWRSQISGSVIGYEGERAIEVRTAGHLFKDFSDPVFSGCLHEVALFWGRV
jgi:hypothetical protein